jgi:glycosyltransferase involved in cell wall biosynthesis
MIDIPLVSIILPVYNAEKYLHECLNSIIAQSFRNWELIIINDGSTDNSETIIHIFIASVSTFNKVIYVPLEHKGLPFCLNKGIGLARGKYIARMDADDIMFENRLQVQVQFLENNPDVGVLGSHAIEIDENGQEISKMKRPIENLEIKNALDYCCPCPIIHPTVMMRKKILEGNLYKELYPNPEDLDLWQRLVKFTIFRNLDIILLKKRFHKKQITQNSRIFRIRLEIIFLKRSLKKKNFNFFLTLLKIILFCILPNFILNFWQEYKLKQRRKRNNRNKEPSLKS